MALNAVAIFKALASNASNAAGLEDAKHFQPDASFSGVAFWVTPERMERATLGSTRWHLEVVGKLRIFGAWDRSNDEKMGDLLPLVWLAIEGDRTAGGFAQDLAVMSADVVRADDGAPVGVDYRIAVEA